MRAEWLSGSSTKSTSGLFSKMRENSSPAGLQLVILGVMPRYILNATCQVAHNNTVGNSENYAFREGSEGKTDLNSLEIWRKTSTHEDVSFLLQAPYN